MEEVKNQIGEQLPGALDLFVKAASEFAKKDLTTPEFFKMMQDGELLAKDILPLMGKYMSEAAKKGGALEKMLKGNMVAMNRLRQTWQNFQNDIFMGGFGEALTKWFNQLAAMLKSNTGFAKTFGAVLGSVMDQLLDKFTMIYDYILIFWLEFKYYILDSIPEGLKGIIGDFLAWAASILIVVKTFAKLYAVIKMIMGLGSLKKSLGMDTGPSGGKGPTKGAKIMQAGLTATMVGPFVEELMDWAIGDTTLGKWAKATTLGDLGSMATSALTPSIRTDMRPSLQNQSASQQTSKVEVGVKVNDGAIKDMIELEYVKLVNELGVE